MMMAPDMRSTKARSASLAHMKICTAGPSKDRAATSNVGHKATNADQQ